MPSDYAAAYAEIDSRADSVIKDMDRLHLDFIRGCPSAVKKYFENRLSLIRDQLPEKITELHNAGRLATLKADFERLQASVDDLVNTNIRDGLGWYHLERPRTEDGPTYYRTDKYENQRATATNEAALAIDGAFDKVFAGYGLIRERVDKPRSWFFENPNLSPLMNQYGKLAAGLFQIEAEKRKLELEERQHNARSLWDNA